MDSLRRIIHSHNLLVIAPHVDDEVIGCWSYLSDPHRFTNRHVHYTSSSEMSSTRLAEAKTLSSLMGHSFSYNTGKEELPEVVANMMGAGNLTVMVPDRGDTHPDHKAANASWRGSATHFYSVDMDLSARRTMTVSEQLKKISMLDACFPSQKDLWATNAKYYIFECIRRSDITSFIEIKEAPVASTLPWVVTIESTVSREDVLRAIREAIGDTDDRLASDIINRLARLTLEPIEVKSAGRIWRTK